MLRCADHRDREPLIFPPARIFLFFIERLALCDCGRSQELRCTQRVQQSEMVPRTSARTSRPRRHESVSTVLQPAVRRSSVPDFSMFSVPREAGRTAHFSPTGGSTIGRARVLEVFRSRGNRAGPLTVLQPVVRRSSVPELSMFSARGEAFHASPIRALLSSSHEETVFTWRS